MQYGRASHLEQTPVSMFGKCLRLWYILSRQGKF